MSDFRNEEGEYLMTAAELALEYELDMLAAQERYEEEWYEQNRDDEPVCNHEDEGYPDLDYLDNGVECPWCGETLLGPHTGDKRNPWGEIVEHGTFVVNY